MKKIMDWLEDKLISPAIMAVIILYFFANFLEGEK